MTRKHYNLFLRALALAASVAMWRLSVQFSEMGFGFSIPDMNWAGIALALCVTVVQLIWSKEGMKGNATILLGGFAAYMYGIYTNVVGIRYAQQFANVVGATENPLAFAIPLAVFIEVLPEPLFVWSIIGSSVNTGGDFVTNIVGMFGLSNLLKGRKKPQYSPQQPRNMPVPMPEQMYRPVPQAPGQQHATKAQQRQQQYQQIQGNKPSTKHAPSGGGQRSQYR